MIRKVEITELEKLCELSRQTFIETFAKDNQAKDLEDYIAQNLTVEKLRSELLNPNSFFYFVEYEGIIAGFLKLNINQAQTEYQTDDSLEVERIYVKQAFQGKGCGKELFDFAISKTKELAKKRIWLGVWEHNHKALKFYQRYVFKQIDRHTFWMGTDAQTDYIYQLML
ncbi:MAG TPA: GNAT family N-acetyltransferase [Enterococcus columbae]|nr:GNAT family N-acetyltransferase [Enterococcus columbae]